MAKDEHTPTLRGSLLKHSNFLTIDIESPEVQTVFLSGRITTQNNEQSINLQPVP